MTGSFGATSTTDDVLSGKDLGGKRVFVTGVSAGLGVETARARLHVELGAQDRLRCPDKRPGGDPRQATRETSPATSPSHEAVSPRRENPISADYGSGEKLLISVLRMTPIRATPCHQ
jgi:hypothetical protein